MYICLYLLYFACVVVVIAAAVFYSFDICLLSHITRRNHDEKTTTETATTRTAKNARSRLNVPKSKTKMKRNKKIRKIQKYQRRWKCEKILRTVLLNATAMWQCYISFSSFVLFQHVYFFTCFVDAFRCAQRNTHTHTHIHACCCIAATLILLVLILLFGFGCCCCCQRTSECPDTYMHIYIHEILLLSRRNTTLLIMPQHIFFKL